MRTTAITLFAMLFISVFVTANEKQKGTLVLNFNNLKSDIGHVVVKLYDETSPKFPDTKSAITIVKGVISNGSASIMFNDLPYGSYAFTTFHDENNNGAMDTNFLHFPTEGYAFSNNRKVVFGPPSFARSSFKIEQETVIVDVKMNY